MEALRWMHSRGIAHLDIKPQNIVFVDDTSLRIKLIDFGSSQRFIKGTKQSSFCGTPQYAAPGT